MDKQRTFSSKTLLHYHRALSAIFNKAVKWGCIFSNPCERVDAPKLNRREARYLNEEQASALLKSLSDAPLQYRVMINLMMFTGARRGEICGLRWSNVNFESGTIHIENNSLYLPDYGMYEDTPKTESSVRTINIPHTILELLAEHLKRQEDEKQRLGDKWIDSGMVFTQWNGKPIHSSTISAWLRKHCKQNGLPHTTPHMLRHPSAILLLMQGVPLKAVSKRLGHTLASTTSDIYGHSLPSIDDIAADTLDDLLNPGDALKNKKG